MKCPKCPKCGYQSLNQENEVNRCCSCGDTWTSWQQDRIEELESLLKEIAEHEHLNISPDLGYYKPDKYMREQGHRDGHRCAAAIARRAFEQQSINQKGE
jgi:hypothetical protein